MSHIEIFSLDRTPRDNGEEGGMLQHKKSAYRSHQRERTRVFRRMMFTTESDARTFERWVYWNEIDWYFSFDKRFYNSIKTAASLAFLPFHFAFISQRASRCPSPVASRVLSAFIVIFGNIFAFFFFHSVVCKWVATIILCARKNISKSFLDWYCWPLSSSRKKKKKKLKLFPKNAVSNVGRYSR